MFTFVLVFGIIIAFLLILVVLIQNPKGGGIASNFSAGNQIFGVKRTTDFIEKITWGCAAAILMVSLLASSQNGVPTDTKGAGAAKTTDEQLDKAMNMKAPVSPNTNTQPANQPGIQPMQSPGPAQPVNPQGGATPPPQQ